MKKRICLVMGCLAVVAMLAGCSEDAQTKGFKALVGSNYYNDYSGGSSGSGDFEATGKAVVGDELSILYVAPTEDTTIKMHGKLKEVSGDVKIVYETPDGDEVVLADILAGDRDTYRFNQTIHLKKGEGEIEFIGNDVTFKFDLSFTDINHKKFDYISNSKPEPVD